MAFKPKQESTGEHLNFEGVNRTLIEQEEMIAIITLNVDLGVQKGQRQVSYNDPKQKDEEEKITVVKTEAEAEELIEEMIDIFGETLADKLGLDEMPEENEDGQFELPFEIYTAKDCQEVAIFADCPECMVEYVEDQPVQYRHMFNRSYAGEISGFKFKSAPPQGKSKLWTFSPKSVLYDLASKTGNTEIISEGDDNMDIDLWLGSALRLNVTENNKYPRFDVNKLGKREVEDAAGLVEDLTVEPMSILFDDEVEDLVKKLTAAKLRYGIIKKMKAATNFEGSNMEAALKIIEAQEKAKKDKEDSDDAPVKTKSSATREAAKKGVASKSGTSAKKTTTKKVEKVEEEEVATSEDEGQGAFTYEDIQAMDKEDLLEVAEEMGLGKVPITKKNILSKFRDWVCTKLELEPETEGEEEEEFNEELPFDEE